MADSRTVEKLTPGETLLSVGALPLGDPDPKLDDLSPLSELGRKSSFTASGTSLG